jgi:hypothetical protein
MGGDDQDPFDVLVRKHCSEPISPKLQPDMGTGAHSKVRVKNDRVRKKKARDKKRAAEAGAARAEAKK